MKTYLSFADTTSQSAYSPGTDRSFTSSDKKTSSLYSVTLKNISSFLINVAQLPGEQTTARDEFFHALKNYIAHFPYCQQDIRIRTIFQAVISSGVAFPVFWNYALYMSSNRNLFCQRPYNPLPPDSSFVPLLSPSMEPSSKIPAQTLKEYLSETVKSLNDMEQRLIQERPISPNTILYYVLQNGADFYEVSYRSDGDSFCFTPVQRPILGAKALPYHVPTNHVSKEVASILYRMTGGDSALVDQLFSFFSKVLDSTPGITILCAPQNHIALMSFLRQAFGSLICPMTSAKDKRNVPPLLSLNEIASFNCLRDLYCYQVEGKAAVLLRDLPYSKRNSKTIKKLIHGKSISLSLPWLYTQHYTNTLHLICISDDPKHAQQLREQSRATLIDLSSHELPCPNNFLLTEDDIIWLQNTVPLYGLKLRCGKHSLLPLENESIDSGDCVNRFLIEICSISDESCCDGYSLYDAYDSFYRSTHDGKAPLLTKVTFIKKARSLIGHGTLKSVSYKKFRASPRSDPRWYFIGLGLPLEPSPPVVTPSNAEDSFSSYLNQIRVNIPSLDLRATLMPRIVRRAGQNPSSSEGPFP